MWHRKRCAQAILLSALAISFLGSVPKVPPELPRSEGRVGEDTKDEVVSSPVVVSSYQGRGQWFFLSGSGDLEQLN